MYLYSNYHFKFYLKQLLAIAFFLFYSISLAQNKEKKINKIDSLLLHVKQNTQDTIKVHLYHQIFKEYHKVAQDKKEMVFYNNKIFSISKKINYQRGIGFYYLNLANISHMSSKHREGILYSKKAKDIFKRIKDKKNILRSILTLCSAYMDNFEYDIAINTLIENQHLFLNSKSKNDIGYFFEILGVCYYQKNDINNAIRYLKKSLNNDEDKFDKRKKENTHIILSYIYRDLEQFEVSNNYIDIVLKDVDNEFIKSSLKILKIDNYNDLGLYSKSLKMALQNDTFFTNIEQNTYQSLETNRISLAKCYLGLKQYNKSIQTLFTIIDNDLDNDLKIDLYKTLSMCYLNLNHLEKAEKYINNSLNLIDSIEINRIKYAVYFNKYSIEKAKNNAKNALFFYEKYTLLKEQENNIIRKAKVLDLQNDYDLNQKNNIIKDLKIIELNKNQEITNQKNSIAIILLILIILVLVFIIYIRRYESIKRKNKFTEEKNCILNKIQEVTKKSLEEKEVLLKEIHHRVKNNLQLVMSLLNIQSREINKKEVEKFIQISQSRIASIALIHENLYLSDNLVNVDFKEYISKLITEISRTQENLNNNVTLDVNIGSIFFDIQTSIPLGLIVNELVTNAYKHAFINKKNGNLTIKMYTTNQEIFLEINDNGIGINDENLLKNSLGLKLVKLLTEQIEGSFTIFKNKGTSCILQLNPLLNKYESKDISS